jgi:transcriptional regulator with XRE-family HTH domain
MLSRSELSARLKAARWLAGVPDENGRPRQLSVAALVQMEPIKRNKITKNRIEEIEQTKAEARLMELEKIAEALDTPVEWFTEPNWRWLVHPESLAGTSGQMIPPREELQRRAQLIQDELDALGEQEPPSEKQSAGSPRASQKR